jgi:hypothetical protein
MPDYDNDHPRSLRASLLEHSIYTRVASVADLRQFMEDHVFCSLGFHVAAEAASAGHDMR